MMNKLIILILFLLFVLLSAISYDYYRAETRLNTGCFDTVKVKKFKYGKVKISYKNLDNQK